MSKDIIKVRNKNGEVWPYTRDHWERMISKRTAEQLQLTIINEEEESLVVEKDNNESLESKPKDKKAKKSQRANE